MLPISRNKFNFNDLFIFEMANNHQGSPEHGLRIIGAMADIARRHEIRSAIKFQFRDLDTFIHPVCRESKENKHIGRFFSTRLSEREFATLVEEVKKQGLISMCTPFDEASVDKIERLGIELIKIGSCSAQDWPLLERVAETGKPVICSTGGLLIRDIDKIVSFFQKRAVQFALMHCVAIYPTPKDQFHLNQIEIMRNRYPGITIGFSTHEDPGNLTPVRIACAKGARIFEKHVGIETGEISLNLYSANPEQVESWINAWKEARDACGRDEERKITSKEIEDLRSLMRGVYAKKDIKKGTPLLRTDTFFAMPLKEGQLLSGRWQEGLIADQDYPANEAINAAIRPDRASKKDIIYHTIHAVRGMLNSARIPLSHEVSVEISHHYGIDNFHEIGCILVECFNREYAKKLIIQFPGQWNPDHYHKRKDETFHILQGNLEAVIDGKEKLLIPGDTLWVPRGVLHGFGTKTGVIFEEISTTSFNDDSFYADKNIANMPREERKTRLLNWGRHQLEVIEGDELLGAV